MSDDGPWHKPPIKSQEMPIPELGQMVSSTSAETPSNRRRLGGFTYAPTETLPGLQSHSNYFLNAATIANLVYHER